MTTVINNKREQLWVWLDSSEYGELQRIGTLSRGERGAVSFAYDGDWLTQAKSFPLDPELDLYPGEFFPGHSNFGIFMDSCPDRWGQLLMQRREAIQAREEQRPVRTLDAWDFLLGVQDCTRMGALRFSRPGEDDFLANEALSAPPVTRLAELQEAAFALSQRGHDNLDQVKEWLKVLVAPGSSLGGARPKANVVDEHGRLWIAKFPAADDDRDVAGWEKVVHDMAHDCGIHVPESRLKKIGNGFSTFMVKRFDRIGFRRQFFTSAMARLNQVDTEAASYLELAEFIATYGDGEHLREDLEQLFTRVVFNVLTANRDDHLRNHGFFRTVHGWRLAPAFDMNPSFKKAEHALALDLHNCRPDIRVVLETAPFYQVGDVQAAKIVDRVCGVVSEWERRARKIGLSRLDCLEAEPLFLGQRGNCRTVIS